MELDNAPDVSIPNVLDVNVTKSVTLARLTIVEKIHYQPPDDPDVVTFDGGFETLSYSKDQPYARKLEITKDTAIEWGWVSSPKCVVIRNEKPPVKTVPTKEEVEANRKKVLKVLLSTNGIQLPLCELSLGEHIRVPILPGNGIALSLKNPDSPVKVSYIVFPG